MGSFRERMKHYDAQLSSSRFAGRTQDMVDNDSELGHRARDARWRASSTTRARDLYHMEDRERHPNSSSTRDTGVSSNPRHAGNSSANLIHSSAQSTRRPRDPGYSSQQHVSDLEPLIPRRDNTFNDSSRYGTIPIGYDPNHPSARSRPPATPIPDRFDSDDSDSDRSTHTSWSSYRRASTDPEPDLRYPPINPVRYPHQIDQTEREIARYTPMRATFGTFTQRDLLPLRTSSVHDSDSYRSRASRREGPRTPQSSSRPVRTSSVNTSTPSSGSTLYTPRQRDQLRTSIATSRFQSRNPSPTRTQATWSNIQNPSDLGWENF